MSINGIKYLDKPEQWDELARRCRVAKEIGFDTEFYGVDVTKQSCVGRARVHVWSVAIRTAGMDPLGFHRCRGWCLPVAALTYPPLQAVLEDPEITKYIHNQPVDSHACRNHGVRIRGGWNTLDYLRWKRPDLINLPGRFKLKASMQTMLHREPVCTFKELVSWEREEIFHYTKSKTVKGCTCGELDCRKRKTESFVVNIVGQPHELLVLHTKYTRMVDVQMQKPVTLKGTYELEDIVPGHERFELLCEYAIVDAIAALQLGELCDDTDDPAPWPYGEGGRPGYSQKVCEAVIDMEAVGMVVDVPFCAEMTAKAEADEQQELDWLYRWYVLNGPVEYGPHDREYVDAIWSSPTQKVRLMDAVGFPRSPIWKKGRVKRDKVKLDSTALEWIGKNHGPAKQLCAHLLKLQRIRSSKKYLVKLRDSGGMVFPICGPAGDEDERAGAVTGRLGIKGSFEAQQMPTREEVDFYLLRKAVVA